MNLSTIFEKPIDRPIDGVIKADDEASLRTEVDEYVLTNEVAKRLDDFLTAYTSYQGANGVWISGFFGSGKSHLLKMLSLLLENREIEGDAIVDLFDPKCQQDEMLRGDLHRAVAIPARSILFNIDQKSDVINKNEEMDALLGVFVKVFNEMCGYYAKQGHIAQFERDLDGRHLYDAFKQAYQQAAGYPWEHGREQYILEAHNIATAYAQATDAPPETAKEILKKYREDYKLSIEDFAEQVNSYIESMDAQQPGFRLNFFVDEVGQYIADNIKLMTNLQTVAESLATKSRGRAWVIVTAQEDMDTVLGEMSRQQRNDFSKIQARFNNRLKLTSADVAEVIRMRLLKKNTKGRALLEQLYNQEQNSFRTLFDFADGGQSYRNFRDQEEFVQSYPFIPYQFVLFQSAIQSLSQQNAFEGRHRSVGERSMLEVFQLVAKSLSDHKIGQLATFDLMFEGLRNTLKSQIQSAINTAERNLDSPFAIKLLKALFLVKYIKEFKATPRNLAVLMLPSFQEDMRAYHNQIQEALDLLEQQIYIQRNDEEYAFLTNEEKVVEQEIKNTEIDMDDVAKELGAFIFDDILKANRIRHEETGQDYSFSRKLDDALQGRDHELAIHVISPLYEHAGNETTLRAQSMGRSELMVILPPSARLVTDLTIYKQTEKYYRQNMSQRQQPIVQRILAEKQTQNAQRKSTLRDLVADLVSKASLIISGQELDINITDPKGRLVTGFHQLIEATHTNLRMLRGIAYTENDIAALLKPEAMLIDDEEVTMGEAEQEMLFFVKGQQDSGLRITVLSVVRHFEKKPYGWSQVAIQCILAKLLARGKLEVYQDSNQLEDGALEAALRNTNGFAHLNLDTQIDFTASQVRNLKSFYGDFFNGPPVANDAKALGLETRQKFQELVDKLHQYHAQSDSYPFLAVLTPHLETLQALTRKNYDYYLTDLRKEADALLDFKEDLLNPLHDFMNGNQRQIYDQARTLLQREASNFAYLDHDAESQRATLSTLLDDPACYRGSKMTQAKSLLDELESQVKTLVDQERQKAQAAIEQRWTRMTATGEFADLTQEQQDELHQTFEAKRPTLANESLIAVMRQAIPNFDNRDYPAILHEMTVMATPPPARSDPANASPTEPSAAAANVERADQSGRAPNGSAVIREASPTYRTWRELEIPYDRPWLANEEDIDEYLAALREALVAEIRSGIRVGI
ncbi:MAG: BREX system P-loop protein BrxC [Chloroflexota bacterium]